jgi:mono/diheme cytochrome c family protein
MSRHATTLAAAIALILAATAQAQNPMPTHQHGAAPAAAKPPAPIRTTMQALHAAGGVPKGWKFLMPPGDPARGREAFVALECFACHAVGGEDFPTTSTRERQPGPELTGMGGHHPPEYFAESIVNPNRVIVIGQGYTGSDGLSKMPDYGDTLTVRQLTDLVAYLGSLSSGGAHQHGGASHDMKDMPAAEPRK